MPGKLVSKISQRKCFTLKASDTVKTASSRLHENHVGCMPILDEKKNVVGIISERDYAREIILEGKSSKNTLIIPLIEKLFLFFNSSILSFNQLSKSST